MDAIDQVIRSAIEMMDTGKYQIFEISQASRAELETLKKELEQVKMEMRYTNRKVDELEESFKKSRIHLSEVSRNFHRSTEEDIRLAYEQATQFQTDLLIHREKEVHLRNRRDELQRRIRLVEKNVQRAEMVITQLSVTLDYLSGDFNRISKMLESAKNRQLLGLKIILAQEEERKRISREIHDSVAQSMANLVLRTEFLEKLLDRGEYEVVKEEIKDLRMQVRTGLEEVRQIIFNLRPMALDDLGLIPALRKYVNDFEEKTNLIVEAKFTGKEVRMSSSLEVAVYRFVQEAFSNVLKHAKATVIQLEAAFHPDHLTISIRDNGIGFNMKLLESKMQSGQHYGLIGMRERIEMLEGELRIDSQYRKGTYLWMEIPLKSANVRA